MTEQRVNGITKLSQGIVVAFSCVLCVLEMYTCIFGTFVGMRQTSMHIGLVLSIGFLMSPSGKTKKTAAAVFDCICAALIIITQVYIFVNYKAITHRLQGVDHLTYMEFGLAIVLVVLVLLLTYRTLGWALPVIAVIFLIYQFAAPYLPGLLNYKGISLERFMEQMYLTTQGIYGEPIQICATYVFVFVLFGAFLDKSGTGDFFMEFSKSLVGKYYGGPGLMAVVSSALMGTISGSAVANVATTGVFTIPLMRKTGYEKHFAGAVEAVASTGGQILPPVMGAGAFIMAEYVGISYTEVIKCALIPAVLYFFCIFLQVYFEARRCNLSGVDAAEIMPVGSVILSKGYLAVPLIVLIVMLVRGYSAMRCGFFGILFVIIASALKKETRMSPKAVLDTFVSAAKSIVPVASACTCAGIIICVVRISGIGLKFSSAIISIANGNLLIALVMTMIASLVLGMGLPTTASYIIQATLTAPALITMGLLPIQAHLFVFYFACVAVITPPVALAAYTAAPLCEGNGMKVGLIAFQLGLASFIVPFAFVASPELLMIGSVPGVLQSLLTALIGCAALAAALRGWFLAPVSVIIRILFGIGSVLLIMPDIVTDLAGLLLVIIGAVVQLITAKKGTEPAI